jgi:uncharacterized protein YkwD
VSSRTPALPPARRLVIATFAVVSVLGGALTAAPAAPAQAGPLTAESYGAAAFRATNHQRVVHHRTRLTHAVCLHRFAARQAARMARQQQIYHQDLDRVLRRCHMDLVGENVAYGFATGAAVVDDGWMRSADHRANILEPRFRRMEVVARRGAGAVWYVSQVFGRPA